jgi:hypothetical protein
MKAPNERNILMRLKTTALSVTAACAILATPALATKPAPGPHGQATAPGQLCKSMSHKKTNKGKGKSPFAACVVGATRAQAAAAATPATHTAPAKLCADKSKKKSATDSKSPYAACVSGAAKAQQD